MTAKINLASKDKPVITDGAMATMLFSLGFPTDQITDQANPNFPELVRKVHGEYVQAGARALFTNTFNTFSGPACQDLEKVRLERLSLGINHALDPPRENACVFLALGPWAPTGDKAFLNALLAASQRVSGIIFETCSSLHSLDWIQKLRDQWIYQPIAWGVSFSFLLENGKPVLPDGTTPHQVASMSRSKELDFLGCNCGRNISLETTAQIVVEYKGEFSKTIMARPNAGSPSENKEVPWIPLANNEFARGAKKIVEAGANWIGGCCGTTPAHIRALAEDLQNKPGT
ncbi:MAG: hypothetical protein EXR99_05155 [Gemmataceae bacterium]|nr:hypothetical protein [Gemmataceae bacterium]